MPRGASLAFRLLVPALLFSLAAELPAFQSQTAVAEIPDAPSPQNPSSSPTPHANPCPATPGSATDASGSGKPNAALALNSGADAAANGVHPATTPCKRKPLNWYERFVNGPQRRPLTPRDKGWLAARNVVDPFNLITIGGEAGISVAADSHSPYGPGMPGYARYVGVSMTEDLTGEFIGTFLIPSIAHQDPHYYRAQKASISQRIGHALKQVVWTQGDNGKGMLNYANLIGFAADDAIANLYVPARPTGAGASFRRYGTALATAPIGNLIDEFLPEVASHIHVQIVIIQRIINQVASRETAMSAAQSAEF